MTVFEGMPGVSVEGLYDQAHSLALLEVLPPMQVIAVPDDSCRPRTSDSGWVVFHASPVSRARRQHDGCPQRVIRPGRVRTDGDLADDAPGQTYRYTLTVRILAKALVALRSLVSAGDMHQREQDRDGSAHADRCSRALGFV